MKLVNPLEEARKWVGFEKIRESEDKSKNYLCKKERERQKTRLI